MVRINKNLFIATTLSLIVGCSESGVIDNENQDPEDQNSEEEQENKDEEEEFVPVVTPTGKYNVLLLMVDDLNNWNGSGGYYPESITPNIDKLAQSGVMFQNGFCASPVSNPSRNALWSGFRPATSGIDSNSGGYIRDIDGFANTTTMNQHFLQNGYYTFGVGKLYHNGSMTGDEVDIENWSEVNSQSTGANAGGTKIATYTNSEWTTMTYNIGSDDMSTSNCGDLKAANIVVDLINGYSTSANASKPFFIGCGLFRPHLPWNVSQEFWDQYENSNLAAPVGYLSSDLDDLYGYNSTATHDQVVSDGQWSNSIRAYLSCVTMSDRNVGMIIDAIDESEYKDNTIIILIGDHGWHLGEKKKWGKNTVYNASNKTTFIVRHPAVTNADHVCETAVSLQDIYPTLISLCQLSANPLVEGNDISQLLSNPQDPTWDKPVLGTYSGTHYIQDNEYKYIASDYPQLYNIKDDPYEFYNLYGSTGTSSTAKKYIEMLEDMLEECDVTREKLGLEGLWNE